MSDSSEYYRLGASAGEALLEPGPAVRSAVLQEVSRVQAEQAVRTRAARGAALLLTQVRNRHARHDAEYQAGLAELAITEAEQKRTPGRFTRRRGWLYFGGAAAVLISDAVFLTLVLVSVLGLPPTAASGASVVGPVGALFTGNLSAIRHFSEVYLAAIGLVCLALAFKAWVDAFPRRDASTHASSSMWKRITTPGGGVLVLVCLTFLGVSASRLFLDYGTFGDLKEVTGVEEAVARSVAFLIGLAAFAGGSFLLMSSMEILSNSATLRQQVKRVGILRSAVERFQAEVDHAESIAASEAHQADGDLPEFQLSAARSVVVDAFTRGYVAGLTSMLSTAEAGGAYRIVQQKLCAAETMTSERDLALLPAGR
jgi:hypothetical protein